MNIFYTQTGVVDVNTLGYITVDGESLNEYIGEHIKKLLGKEDFGNTRFAGRLCLTISDYTAEPQLSSTPVPNFDIIADINHAMGLKS